MSLRDNKYEYVRYRKPKDKERDKDNRSSVAGSIVVRRAHKDGSSSSKYGGASDTTSQAPTDSQTNNTLDQLPPLPESASTSPIMRTSSNISLGPRTSPSQVHTPANLQPYLESDAGESEVGSSDSRPAGNLEKTSDWIGPVPKCSPPPSEVSDASTPKASRDAYIAPPATKSRRTSSRASERSHRSFLSNPYHHSEMENPFLATASTSIVLASGHQTTHDAQTHHVEPTADGDVDEQQRKSPSPPADSVVLAGVGARADDSNESVSNTTSTYPSTPHHYGQAPYGDPFMLHQKVTSALPDFFRLIEQYQQHCTSLGIKDARIQHLETEKSEDAGKLERLAEQLRSLLEKHRKERSDLANRIQHLEGVRENLQKQIGKEASRRSDLTASIDKLEAEKRHIERLHRDETEETALRHSQELDRLKSDFTARRRTLNEHYQAQIQAVEGNCSVRIGEATRSHESEKQSIENRRLQEQRGYEENLTKMRNDHETAIRVKVNVIEDERQKHREMQQDWADEQEKLMLARKNDRDQHRKDLEDHAESLTRAREKELDETTRSIESKHLAQHNISIAKMRNLEEQLDIASRQRSEVQDSLIASQKDGEQYRRLHLEAQDRIEKMDGEISKLHGIIETSRAQRSADSQKRLSNASLDFEERKGFREASRQRSDTQELIKLRSELLKEQSRSEDLEDLVATLRQDVETLQEQFGTDKSPCSKGTGELRTVTKPSSNDSTSGQRSLGKSVTWSQ